MREALEAAKRQRQPVPKGGERCVARVHARDGERGGQADSPDLSWPAESVLGAEADRCSSTKPAVSGGRLNQRDARLHPRAAACARRLEEHRITASTFAHQAVRNASCRSSDSGLGVSGS
jgi:hypothetical protein